ncbi:MAG: hypothetical protein HY841_09260 [Bacteroidetes bacterium]|nr:hypothetical protein [Bacteroidota bacterium]
MKIKKWADFLLYSNLFISFCAGAMTIETYFLIHSEINWLYILFVCASTFALYNFQRLFYTAKASGDSKSERHHWIFENKKPLMILSAIALVGIAIIIFSFPLNFILWFLLFGLISLSYFLPFTNLRRIPLVKAALVALVWTCITYYFPVLFLSPSGGGAGGGLSRFFFLLSLAIAFNIRDIEIDRKSAVKTLPVIYGEMPAKLLCVIFLLIFSALVFLSDYVLKIQIALLFSSLVTVILIFNASESRSEYFYSLWMDGMILLQLLLVLIAVNL